MSKCSKKCNEICKKIQSISGLSDDYTYNRLKAIDNIVSAFVHEIDLEELLEQKEAECKQLSDELNDLRYREY